MMCKEFNDIPEENYLETLLNQFEDEDEELEEDDEDEDDDENLGDGGDRVGE